MSRDMYTDEILEEVWRIKDELARKADYDAEKFCDQLEEYSRTHPSVGRVVTPEELRAFADSQHPPVVGVREDETPYGEPSE